MASDDILLIHTDERVRTLTLNSPQSRNASVGRTARPILRRPGRRRNRRRRRRHHRHGHGPGVLRGAGPQRVGWANRASGHLAALAALSKPVIGAINGAAVTGGLELTLYCDILIASEQARFADTHARVGLLPTWGLSVRLPQKVGIGLARRMSLTGDYLSAQDALRAGLVTEVVPHEQLLPAARKVADSIVGNNQDAVRALLWSYHRIDDSNTSEGLWLEATAARAFRTSGDDIAANREAVLQRGRAQVR